MVGKGSDLKTFKIYKETLSYYSPFFASAFSGPFIEGQSQEMKLEDVDGAAFGLMVAWLYTKTISDEDLLVDSCCTASITPSSPLADLEWSWGKAKPSTESIAAAPKPLSLVEKKDSLRLAKLWVLGQRFLIPELQNLAIEKLLPILVTNSGARMIELVDYVYSGEYGELRMLVAEVLAFTSQENPLGEIVDKLCQPALADVTKLFKRFYCTKVKSQDHPSLKDPTRYFVENGKVSQYLIPSSFCQDVQGDDRSGRARYKIRKW
jgi:hypothetical protein